MHLFPTFHTETVIFVYGTGRKEHSHTHKKGISMVICIVVKNKNKVGRGGSTRKKYTFCTYIKKDY